MDMEFQPEVTLDKIIKVIGVGGGGSNAVNYMYKQGIEGVDFYVCNTDIQSLRHSPVPNKLQLGASLTSGLGAGSSAMRGEEAAQESENAIEQMLSDGTRMVFITAGFGGGTGTGAAPVIASIAKKLKILTVGIVTLPFSDEGQLRLNQATEGIEKIRPHVDALITVSNDRIVDMFGDLTFLEAFAQADDILCTAAKGIAEIIFKTGHLNVDFKDVETAMTNSGRALMGMGKASGENRAKDAVTSAIKSPLLDNTKITGSKHILINITYGSKAPSLSETRTIMQFLQEEAGHSATLKMGITLDETLQEELAVTVIATGFESNEIETPHEAIVESQPQEIGLKPTFSQQDTDDIIIEELDSSEPINEAATVNTTKAELENPLGDIFKDFEDSDSNADTIPEQNTSKIEETYHMPPQRNTQTYGIHTKPAMGASKPSGPQIDIFGHYHDSDMNIPAYKRRNIQLASAPASNSSHVEKLNISQSNNENDEPTFQFTPNKMLHDNVD